MEYNCLDAVFGNRLKDIPLAAIKANIGESMSSSAALQMAAAIGTLQNEVLPGTLNVEVSKKYKGLNLVSAAINLKKPENILVNSFGPNGVNTSCIVSKYTSSE